jgi:uncharacterized membrane protein
VILFAALALSFQILRNFTFRCVDDAGDKTTSVVVSVAIAVFSRPGVTVVPDKST